MENSMIVRGPKVQLFWRLKSLRPNTQLRMSIWNGTTMRIAYKMRPGALLEEALSDAVMWAYVNGWVRQSDFEFLSRSWTRSFDEKYIYLDRKLDWSVKRKRINQTESGYREIKVE